MALLPLALDVIDEGLEREDVVVLLRVVCVEVLGFVVELLDLVVLVLVVVVLLGDRLEALVLITSTFVSDLISLTKTKYLKMKKMYIATKMRLTKSICQFMKNPRSIIEINKL